jgi:hypothetical protein
MFVGEDEELQSLRQAYKSLTLVSAKDQVALERLRAENEELQHHRL